MKLIDILKEKNYKTDKWKEHYYVQEVYEYEFAPYRNKEINFLEIGILAGESMKLWSDYFVNAKNVIGMDTFERVGFEEEKVRESLKDYDVELWNMNSISGDQVRYTAFSDKYKKDGLDIVIDDGHHFYESQIKTYQRFSPFMKKGGIYIVEDIGFSQAECMTGIYDKTSKSYIQIPKLKSEIPNLEIQFTGGEHWGLSNQPIGIVRF